MVDKNFLIFIALWALTDRLREVCTFRSWLENSIFIKLKKKFYGIYLWLESDDINEIRKIKIWKIEIPLPPIFWDGYHHFKNLSILIFIIIISWNQPIQIWLVYMITWYIIQVISLKLIVKKKDINKLSLDNLTPKEKDIILSILSSGIACGLTHPVECFLNYLRFSSILPYYEVERFEKEAERAFIKFIRTTSSSPEDPVEKIFDSRGLSKYINSYYQKNSKKK